MAKDVKYLITDYRITVDSINEQSVSFGDLQDNLGNSLPATFKRVPWIGTGGTNLGIEAVVPSKSITGFTITRSGRSKPGASGILTVMLEIVGEPAVLPVNINLRDMSGYLAVLIGDPAFDLIKPKILVQMLNRAQSKVITALNRHVLRQLDVDLIGDDIQTVDSNGQINYITFDEQVYRGALGIDAVRIADKHFSFFKSFDEFREFTDLNKVYTIDNPVHYYRGNYINPHPVTASETEVEVYYQRKADRMFLGATTAEDVDCEFDDEINSMITGMACEDFKSTSKKAKDAFERAVEDIKLSNSLYPISETIAQRQDLIRNISGIASNQGEISTFTQVQL